MDSSKGLPAATSGQLTLDIRPSLVARVFVAGMNMMWLAAAEAVGAAAINAGAGSSLASEIGLPLFAGTVALVSWRASRLRASFTRDTIAVRNLWTSSSLACSNIEYLYHGASYLGSGPMVFKARPKRGWLGRFPLPGLAIEATINFSFDGFARTYERVHAISRVRFRESFERAGVVEPAPGLAGRPSLRARLLVSATVLIVVVTMVAMLFDLRPLGYLVVALGVTGFAVKALSDYRRSRAAAHPDASTGHHEEAG